MTETHKSKNFYHTKTLRIMEEINLAAKDVPWLTMNHMQIILLIFDMETEEGLEAQTIAKITGHQKSTVNRIIHSLGPKRGRGNDKSAGLGWIQMIKDENDMRIQRIHLTPQGKRLKNILRNVGGAEDPVAQALQIEQEAFMYQSKANVVQASVIAKAKSIASASPEVQKAEMKTTPTDGGIASQSKNPRQKSLINTAGKKLQEQSFIQLERAMRYATQNGHKSVKYRGVEVPLIDIGSARKMLKEKKLFKSFSLGVWVYYDDPIKDEYGDIPKFIQQDLNAEELKEYAISLVKQIINDKKDLPYTLDKVGHALNTHQRKFAVDYVVSAVADTRSKLANEAAIEMEKAALLMETSETLLNKSTALAKKSEIQAQIASKATNDKAEQFHQIEAMKDMEEAVATQREAKIKMNEAKATAEKATAMKTLQKEIDERIARYEQLKTQE